MRPCLETAGGANGVFFGEWVEGKIIRCPACGKKVYVEPVDDRPGPGSK